MHFSPCYLHKCVNLLTTICMSRTDARGQLLIVSTSKRFKYVSSNDLRKEDYL